MSNINLAKKGIYYYGNKILCKNSIYSGLRNSFNFIRNKSNSIRKYSVKIECDNTNENKISIPDTKESLNTENIANEPHKHVGDVEINYSNIKGVKAGDSSHYIIQFTCKKCEYRTTRMFTKRSYHHGIVLIKCEGCTGLHLIADNLGWFEDSSINVEDIIKSKGEDYKKLSVEGLFQLSEKDINEELKNTKI